MCLVVCGNASKLAEREGFEPSIRCYSYDGLANRWFRPLTHLSIEGQTKVESYLRQPLSDANHVHGRGITQSEPTNPARFGRKQRYVVSSVDVVIPGLF